jgi:5-methylcytosine-specific restriction endonuclease McrA
MRYINLNKIRMPDGWLARAQKAKDAVLAGASIDEYSSVWKELKGSMSSLLDNKCWYCESPVDRDDNAVDHFRPKNRVYDALSPHTGYRWLAFDKDNFRFACTYCNSRRIDLEYGTAGGKADRFPLLDESKRVYTNGSIEFESPELLDPCEMEDCELIGCMQENGHPCSGSEREMDKRRVKSSIEIYHLDREATCIRRHSILVGLISDILEGKKLFDLYQGDPDKKTEFLKVAKRIQSTINRDAPYSGEMRYLLRGQRSPHHTWMQQLLEL